MVKLQFGLAIVPKFRANREPLNTYLFSLTLI